MKYWEPTQRVLQGDPPLVRRPKLTEALLKKPPFRFLHDVISELSRQTGFAQGLFTGEELISTNIKEKKSKVAYLLKIIDCVGITLNTNVPVRPLKIVAGLEPEQTNVFLQMLAAATMVDKRQSEIAVARVLAGEKQPSSSHSGLEWIQLISEAMSAQDAVKASEQPPLNVEAGQRDVRSVDRELLSLHIPADANKAMEIVATETGPTHQAPRRTDSSLHSEPEQFEQQMLKTSLESNQLKNDVNLMGGTLRSIKCPEGEIVPTPLAVPRAICNITTELPPTQWTSSKDNTPTRLRKSRAGSESQGETATTRTEIPGLTLAAPLAVTSPSEDARAGSAALSGCEATVAAVMGGAVTPAPTACVTPRLSTPSVFPGTTSSLSGLRPQSARPQSARKAPPVIRSVLDKVGAKEIQGLLLERPASARISRVQVSADVPVQRPNILLEVDLSDDEQENVPVLLPPPSIPETTVPTSVEDAGKLVRDILENKQYDLPKQQGEQGEKIDDAEETGIILGPIRGTAAKRGDVQSRKDEIQKLRDVVQSLCKIVNPLGKAIDHLQEDAEIMRKEYQFWIKERETYSVRVGEEKRVTEEMLQSEGDRVLELDEEIKQQNQRILSLKVQVLRNDETIMKLLRTVTNRTTRYA
ncbi:hypothetical protein R1flu_019458 [Riccia fluitans]|uniref:TRAF3-interacting protein 1 n=1 Tax=Riccia fluitans TaxID=41844 RepID=A0ABD1ZIQ4_9MARC